MAETGTVRFLHTADWQLGMTRHWLGEHQGAYDRARINAIRRIGQVAEEQGCEFIVVCGDVFEYAQVKPRTAEPALERLGELPVPVYLLPGNHDPLTESGIYRSDWFGPQAGGRVRVLDSPGLVPVRPGVELLAAPWYSKQPPAEQIDRLALRTQAPPPGTVRIAVGHGGVDSLASALTVDPISTSRLEQAVADGRVDYVALGDRHSRFSVGDSGRIRYSGSPEPTATRDPDPGFVLVVELGADRAIEVTPHQVGTWTFAERRFELAEPSDVDAVFTWLDAFPNKWETVAKPILSGALGLAESERLRAGLESRGHRFAAILESGRSTLRARTEDADLDELALTGFVADTAASLRDRGGEAANDALRLLLRLAGN
ncbi:MAG TPA: DNA repair exonuclease [Actinospica sp.]|nr:DNA repair exonuclease [Actinospica sp.]